MQLEPGLGGGQEDSCLYPRGGSPGGLRAEEVLTGALWWAIQTAREMQKTWKIPTQNPSSSARGRWQRHTHQVTLGNALPSLGPESGSTIVQDLIIPERHHSKQGQSYEPPKTNHLLLIRVSQFLKKGKFSKNSPLFFVEAVCLSGDRGFPRKHSRPGGHQGALGQQDLRQSLQLWGPTAGPGVVLGGLLASGPLPVLCTPPGILFPAHRSFQHMTQGSAYFLLPETSLNPPRLVSGHLWASVGPYTSPSQD